MVSSDIVRIHFVRINLINGVMNILKHTCGGNPFETYQNLSRFTSFCIFPRGLFLLLQDLLLYLCLLVELVEVVDDDGDGQRDAENSTDGAGRPNLGFSTYSWLATTSRHVTSRHVTSRHVTLRLVTSCHGMSRHITSDKVASHHKMSHHVKSCHITSLLVGWLCVKSSE